MWRVRVWQVGNKSFIDICTRVDSGLGSSLDLLEEIL